MRAIFASHQSGMTGGAEQSFFDLVTALHHDGRVRVIAATPREGALADSLRAEGVPVHCLPTPLWAPFGLQSFRSRLPFHGLERRARRVLGMARWTPAWVQLFRNVAADVVVTSTATPVLPAIAAALTRIPHVWWIQEFVTRDHGLKYVFGERASQRMIAVLSTEVVVNSCALAHHFSPPVDQRRMHVVRSAIEPSAITPNAIVPGEVRLLLLGRLVPSKGTELAIRALKYLREEPFAVTLRVVGRGGDQYLEHLRSVARNMGVYDMVEFAEFTTQPEQEIERANMLLMCSDDEAFGRVTAEALVNGRPVIGTRSGGTVELVADGFDGLLFAPGDSRALANAIRTLGSDTDLLAAMSRNAIERNRRRFSTEEELKGFINVLVAATGTKRSRRCEGRYPQKPVTPV
jgi:glycosyltransferase involved in cell wall biosynthesis